MVFSQMPLTLTGSGHTVWTELLDQVGASFALARPDFVFACPYNGQIMVVDAKSYEAIKISHLTQVSIYSILLEELICSLNLRSPQNHLHVASKGGIWLPGMSEPYYLPSTITQPNLKDEPLIEEGPILVDLEAVKEAVHTFLRDDLVRICSAPESSLGWQLASSCQTCDHVQHCRTIQTAPNGIPEVLLGHVPYLDHDVAANLASHVPTLPLIQVQNYPVRDIEDFLLNINESSTVPVTLQNSARRALLLNSQQNNRNIREILEDELSAPQLRPDTFIEDLGFEAQEHVIIDAIARPDILPIQPLSITCYFASTNTTIQFSADPNSVLAQSSQVNKVLSEHFVELLYDRIHSMHEGAIRLAVLSWSERSLEIFTTFLINFACSSDGLPSLREQATLLAWTLGDRQRLVDLPYTVDLFGFSPVPNISYYRILARAELDIMFNNLPQEFCDWYLEGIGQEPNLRLRAPRNGLVLNKEGVAKAVFLYNAQEFFRLNFLSVEDSNVDELLDDARERYFQHINDAKQNRVFVVEAFVKKYVMIPKPGFFSFQDCLDAFGVHVAVQEDNVVQQRWITHQSVDTELLHRVQALWQLTSAIGLLTQTVEGWIVRKITPFLRFPRLLSITSQSLIRACTIEQQRVLKGVQRYQSLRSAEPREVLVSEGRLPRLIATGENARVQHKGARRETWDCQFRIDPTLSDLEIDATPTIKSWILVPDTRDSWRNLLAYDDLRTMDSLDPPISGGTASIIAVQGGLVHLRTAGYFNAKDSERVPRPGQAFFLVKRYTNFTCSKVLKGLMGLSVNNPADVLTLIANPVAWNTESGLPVRLDEGILSSLQPSQRRAALRCANNRLQVIWGPPGSGKTFSSAYTILSLLNSAPQGCNRIAVVMANTNSAIINCLEKIHEATGNLVARGLFHPPLLEDIVIRQITAADASSYVKALPPGNINQRFLDSVGERGMIILGATPWQLEKVAVLRNRTFVLLVDEASQIHEAHALLGLRVLDPENGHLVVVGDHKQLPPIEELSNSKPRSFLDACIHSNIDHGLMHGIASKLTENLRMNAPMGEVLHGIYGEDYRVVPAHRRLGFRLRQHEENPPLHRYLRDPTIGLYFVEAVADPLASASDLLNAEALFAVEIAQSYRQYFSGRAGESWTSTLLIVTPHHNQRRTVRRQLIEAFGTKEASQICVDTVEKAQGQTFDFVLVLFGVPSREAIARESTFIFDERRLNVAISRARFRTIVFAGSTLSSPPVEALLDQQARQGWAALRRLRAFADSKGTRQVFRGLDVFV